MKQPYVELLGLLLCAVPGSALAQDAPASPPNDTTSTLATMDKTYTQGHPDLFNEFAGMRRYEAGDYSGAMKDFLQAAYYADKPSQLSIGLMYLRGQGIEKDPVKAYAWVSVAAERQYPQFTATQNQVWADLDSQQRKEAKVMQQTIAAQYGDAVAKPRMLQAIRDSKVDMTAGINYGASADVHTYNGVKICAQDNFNECSDPYAKWYWDPNNYFAGRDATWRGTVTMGPLQNVHGNGQ
ncbi:sel1 repeat family protein [Dyella dinghuensis]|uniref:Sel1 repeat family protein n=1 Tax=Dyella dinghuensis TaxID=1920169 RepID=A0A432LTP2_9GAMM|nr:sel1 repeat family protein [Dyella dinghuensis]RUL64178.1 sel1 repeat family protein [Dyella dinghuensis]